MAFLKKKARKRFAKEVRKLVDKYGSETVTSVVTDVIEAAETQVSRPSTLSAKQAKKRKAASLHAHTPTAYE